MRISRRDFLGGVLAVAAAASLDSLVIEPQLALTVERVELDFGGQLTLRMALVADTHFTSGYISPSIREALRTIEGARPDLIMVAGDLVSSKEGWSSAKEFLSGLRSISPVIAVWGNHDHWHLGDLRERKRELREMGVKVLVNEGVTFEGINVVGVDDPFTGHSDLGRALAGSGEGPRILVAHSPQIIGEAKDLFELVVSGHTHGGQVVIPLLGPPFVPLPAEYRRYVSGLYTVGGTKLYVNRGLGTSFFPVRFNCPPEVTLLEVSFD